MSDPRVLDENLRRLIQRAYVPCKPLPAFRERACESWLAQVDHIAARRASTRPRPLFSGPRLAWAAAALVLALVYLGYLVTQSQAVLDPWELLRLGEVAVREGGPAWRAASASELADGIAWKGGELEVQTPAGRSLKVELTDGELSVLPETVLSFESGEPLRARMQGAGLDVLRTTEGAPWVLSTYEGNVHLEMGSLELSEDPLGVRLESSGARAYVPGPDARPHPVPRTGTAMLYAGLLIVDPPDTSVASADQPDPTERRVLELDGEQGVRPEAPSTVEETPSGLGLLLGAVVDAESGAPVQSFSVALLGERRENRPDVAQPSRHRDEHGTFRREEIAFGEWSVYVHAEGYALLHAGKLQFSADEPVHEIRAQLRRGGEVRGYVIDSASGDPVAGAQVLSERDTPAWGLPFHAMTGFPIWSPASTRSRPDGSFTLPHLSAGRHVLKVSASGHAPAWSEELVVAEGGRLDGVEIALGEGGAIEGRVTDSAGRPVRGAMLIAFQTDGSMSYAIDSTDAEGRYELRDLPTGMLLVVLPEGVEGEKDLPEVKPCALEAGETAVVDFLGERVGTRLTGRLLDPTGAPLGERNLACFSAEDVQLRGDWQATSTSPEGRYAFDDLEPGLYLIQAVGSMGTELFLIDVVDVPPVAELERDLHLGAFRLEGRVVDALTEEPVAGGFLLLERHDSPSAPRSFAGYVLTDEEGRYAFEHLPQGTYRLVAYPPLGTLGFEEEPSIELGPERPSALRDFALWPGGTIRVTVVDPDGEPVAGAFVSLLGEGGRTFEFSEDPVTDARGVYEAVGCRPGSFRVRVEHSGHRVATKSTECREGERVEVRVVLRPDSSDER